MRSRTPSSALRRRLDSVASAAGSASVAALILANSGLTALDLACQSIDWPTLRVVSRSRGIDLHVEVRRRVAVNLVVDLRWREQVAQSPSDRHRFLPELFQLERRQSQRLDHVSTRHQAHVPTNRRSMPTGRHPARNGTSTLLGPPSRQIGHRSGWHARTHCSGDDHNRPLARPADRCGDRVACASSVTP